MPTSFTGTLDFSGFQETKTKAALPGIVPPGVGDVYGSVYLDSARKQRVPTRQELFFQFRNSVFVCCNLNAEGVVSTPLKLYVQTKTGDPRPKCRVKSISKKADYWIRSSSSMSGAVSGDADVEEVTDHPILDLWAKPNPWMSWAFLSRLTTLYMDLVGNTYWWIGKPNRLGIPKEIWPLPAHLVYPWRAAPTSDENTDLVDYYLFTSYRMQYMIPPEEIIHFRMFNPWDPYTSGISPLHATFEFVNTAEKMLGHTQAALDNQARPDALVTPAEVVGRDEADRLEKKLNLKFRAAGYGGIMVAESNMDVKELQWNPADLQALEVYAITKDMIFDAYGVPQALATKDTNLANLQASLNQHARFGIKPRLVTRDEVLNRALIPLYDDSGRLFACSDNPVPEDETLLLNKRTAMSSTGTMKPNEWRTAEGLPEEPWGDVPRAPSTMQPLDDSGIPIPPKLPPGQQNGGQGSGGNSRSGNGKNGPKGGGSGGKGDKKKPKKDKKKKKKKGLIEAVTALNSKVGAGIMSRFSAVSILCREFDLTSDYADSLIAIEPPTRNPHLKTLADQIKDKAAKGDNLDWQEPDLKNVKNTKEIKRAVDELGNEGIDIDTDTLADCLADGKMQKLDDKTWKAIINTESRKVDTIEDIRRGAKQRGKKIRHIFEEFILDTVKAPILVCYQEKPDKYYLVNGETRLSVASLFDLQPQVWLADLPDEVKKKAVDPPPDNTHTHSHDAKSSPPKTPKYAFLHFEDGTVEGIEGKEIVPLAGEYFRAAADIEAGKGPAAATQWQTDSHDPPTDVPEATGAGDGLPGQSGEVATESNPSPPAPDPAKPGGVAGTDGGPTPADSSGLHGGSGGAIMGAVVPAKPGRIARADGD
jgi:HK97 family phage portal protein